MQTTVINCFEESNIKNRKLPLSWREQDDLDELSAFLQSNWEQRAVFFDDGEISSRQQYMSFTGQKGIRTNNYIGTVVFKGERLNIFPKVFREDRDDNDTDNLNVRHLMHNVVQWLQYCNKFNYPFISISSELEDSSDLKDLFITLYVHFVRSTLNRSPFYRYEEVCEDLPYKKGKIDFSDYVQRKIPNGLQNKFKCTFSEFLLDNSVNRIIKYTCKSLLNGCLSSRNRQIIQNILIRLKDVSDVVCYPNSCDAIQLSYLHRNYQTILSMSKMFLLNQTSTYNVNNDVSFCFLFPTELMFEGFIGGFIQDMLSQEATVRLQASELTLISDVVYDGHSLGKAFTMRHDILIEHKEKGIFILDTKYKHMSRFEGNPDLKSSISHDVNQADLYQVIEYAAHRDIDSAYLLYPMYRFEDDEPSDMVLKRVSTSGKTISVHLVRLPFVFENDDELIKKRLSSAIEKSLNISTSI